MSLSKRAVAELAETIKGCRTSAFAHADGKTEYLHSYLVGSLEAAISNFVQRLGQDSTELAAAFEYVPSAEEVAARKELWAKWQRDGEARRATAGSAP